MYATSVAIAGYVPLPLLADDYIQLLPHQARRINSYGVKIGHRVYDCEELNPYRGQPSGVAALRDRWVVHHDPYDVTRVWVCNHHDGGWITAWWRQLRTPAPPFGEAAWRYAHHIVTQRGITGPSEEAIVAAVDELLDRASPPPPGKARKKKTAAARRVAARTKATAHLSATAIPPAATQSTEFELAAVVPLPVFDPAKEAQSWW